MVKTQLLHKYLAFVRALAYDSTGKPCNQASSAFLLPMWNLPSCLGVHCLSSSLPCGSAKVSIDLWHSALILSAFHLLK